MAAGSPESDDAPIRALYVCGNRFVLSNAQPFRVPVTWRIQSTDEQGDLALAAAPDGDPGFSEIEVTTRHQGPLEVYRGDQLLAVRDNERLACEPTMGPAFSVAGTASGGSWSAPFSWPIVAVHVYDPANGSFKAVLAGVNIFCSGHAFLPDGRLFVAGGHISDNHGLRDVHLFNPATLTWSKTADMRQGRWYPSLTELGTSSVVALAGKDENAAQARTQEIWSGGTWRALTGAVLAVPYYPRQFLAPNGKVFVAGDVRTTRYLNTSGSGSWSIVADRRYGVRDNGAAAMYLSGKILYAGGGRTTATAEIVDLNQAAPVWKYTGSMAYPRRHLNATMLPTGEVLVTGGTRGTGFNDPSLAVHVAEIWNPTTGAWRQVASILHAVHPDLERSAVEGQDHQVGLSPHRLLRGPG